jgi:hypothetical protein
VPVYATDDVETLRLRWVKSIGAIKHKNTADAPVATMEEAQAQCLAYVRKCLDDAGSAK